jgi:hypothetical protein
MKISTTHTKILTSQLVPGDVLLIAGQSALARMIRMIEGTSFDHVAMVAPPNAADPKYGHACADDRTDELWMCDVGLVGGRWMPVTAYEDSFESIAVRRHRSPVGKAVETAIGIAQRTDAYAWDRMLYLTLIAATRWTYQLASLDDRQSAVVVKAFYGIIDRIVGMETEKVGERRICTEILMESFETTSDVSPHAHLGLYIPSIQHEGLLWWASGLDTFAEFLRSQPVPPERSSIERTHNVPDPAVTMAVLHELASTNGVTFPGVSEPGDAELRTIIIDGTALALSRFVQSPTRDGLAALVDPRKLAWNLLDIIMKRRLVVTPLDIAATPTLVDIGILELESLGPVRDG